MSVAINAFEDASIPCRVVETPIVSIIYHHSDQKVS